MDSPFSVISVCMQGFYTSRHTHTCIHMHAQLYFAEVTSKIQLTMPAFPSAIFLASCIQPGTFTKI